MKSVFLFFLGWLFCSGLFAQEELFRTFKVCRQSDTVRVSLSDSSFASYFKLSCISHVVSPEWASHHNIPYLRDLRIFT